MNTPYSHMAANMGRAWANMELRRFGINITRSSKETSETLSVVVLESDIPGSSVNGRNPLALKNDELHFWLKRP